jgi:hypothetical protein
MVDFAIDTVTRLTKIERKRVNAEGQLYDSNGRRITTRAYMSSWRKGVVNGMGVTLKAIKKQNEDKNAKNKKDRQYAMVVLSELEKAKQLQQEMFPNTKVHRRKQTGDQGIFNNGTSAGQKVGFNKQAGSGTARGLLK